MDIAEFTCGSHTAGHIASMRHSLIVVITHLRQPHGAKTSVTWQTIPAPSSTKQIFDDPATKWKFLLWNAGIGKMDNDDGLQTGIFQGAQTSILIVPYWLLVIPLTLLSTYLLMSKPRQVKRAFSELPEGNPA